MRNQLPCRVVQLESVDVRDPIVNVLLQLPSGEHLSSTVTRESIDLLDLKPERPVLALCKATAVQIRPAQAETGGGQVRNYLSGSVLRISRGIRSDELVLTLSSGQQLVGFAARPNRLREGSKAQACIDASSVVLAMV